MGTNWRSYGLTPVARLAAQRPGDDHGPHGQRVGAVHQRIERSDRQLSGDSEGTAAGLQAVGRKLGMYLRRRLKVKQEGERRNIFLRYLGEVATAVSDINKADREKLYDQLLAVAKKKTAEADVKLDERGKPIEEDEDLARTC